MDGMLISIIVFLVVYIAITFELINHIITEKGEINQNKISGIADKIVAEY